MNVPKFFFDILSHDERIDDPIGMEFSNVYSARVEALKAARELMVACLIGSDAVFDIVDEQGITIAKVPFAEALRTDDTVR